jgi:small-conductance mechanosensitive channel
VSVAVPLATDLDRVREVLVEEARAAPESVSDREPTTTVTQLEASHAVVALDAWARTADAAGRLAERLRESVQRRLRAEGIYA